MISSVALSVKTHMKDPEVWKSSGLGKKQWSVEGALAPEREGRSFVRTITGEGVSLWDTPMLLLKRS